MRLFNRHSCLVGLVACVAFALSTATVFAAPRAATPPIAAPPDVAPPMIECSKLDAVVATFVGHGTSVYMIPADRLALVAQDAETVTGTHYSGVTRGFLVAAQDSVLLGLEVGGCLLDPIRLALPSSDTPQISA